MDKKLKAALITGGVVASGIGGVAWLSSSNSNNSTNTDTTSSSSQSSVIDNVDKDCSDFGSHQEAQDYFESQGGSPSNNVDRLDRDRDGLACEAN